jgi:hypothetical protein
MTNFYRPGSDRSIPETISHRPCSKRSSNLANASSPAASARGCSSASILSARLARSYRSSRSPGRACTACHRSVARGLKVAMVLFHERLPEHLDANLVIAFHDELVVECPEEQAEEVARFVEAVMVAGMDEILNSGLVFGRECLSAFQVLKKQNAWTRRW